MRAVFLPGRRRVDVRDVPVPQPARGELLVRLHASTLCGSEMWNCQGRG